MMQMIVNMRSTNYIKSVEQHYPLMYDLLLLIRTGAHRAFVIDERECHLKHNCTHIVLEDLHIFLL